MRESRVIIGVFESILDAQVAKRDLNAAGINSTIINNSNIQIGESLLRTGIVNLAVPFEQMEEAKKIIQVKYY